MLDIRFPTALQIMLTLAKTGGVALAHPERESARASAS